MFSRASCLVALALLAPCTGCVSKTRFNALETQAQVLGEQNRALLAENENYKQRLRQLTGGDEELPTQQASGALRSADGWAQAADADPAYTR